jgi:hypothetical protein
MPATTFPSRPMPLKRIAAPRATMAAASRSWAPSGKPGPRSILRCGAIRPGVGCRWVGRFDGAGRPVDGGRGRTWDGRWRRLVIDGHCRTPVANGTAPRRARRVVLWRGEWASGDVRHRLRTVCRPETRSRRVPSTRPVDRSSASGRSLGWARASLLPPVRVRGTRLYPSSPGAAPLPCPTSGATSAPTSS